MASSSIKLTLKLLIDTKREKVLFAEASKAVVDFLFNLLCLPLSTVVRLLNKNGMVGSLGNLYRSVENLDENYVLPNQHKDSLLNPTASISLAEISSLVSSNDGRSNGNLRFYTCPTHSNYVTCFNQTRCPHRQYVKVRRGYKRSELSSKRKLEKVLQVCECLMNCEVHYVGNKDAENVFSDESGFVKEVVTYMVMDDLVIQPMSNISSITLLNKLNVKKVGDLQEKVVELGMTQGVNLLKASLQSKMVLTSVFLKNSIQEIMY